MAQENLQHQLQQAKEESQTLRNKPSNDMLLQLYAWYKQATEGDAGEAPNNPFDIVGKAKYQAWSAVAGTSKDEAAQRYIDLVKELKAADA